MLARSILRLFGGEMPAQAGYRALSQKRSTVIDGDNVNITVASLLGGVVRRTGATGATTDVMPTVDSILAALPDLSRGDSFGFLIQQAAAQAITLTAGTGMTALGTINVLASNTREYLLTLTSDNKRTRVVSATTTNANKTLSNISATDLANIGVGMAVTGTGIGASAKVVAVNYSAGTVLVDVDSTATADNIAVTFTPQMTLHGLRTGAI